jgi:hypothetical protein
MTCASCSHPEREALDRDLILGKSVRYIEGRYGPSKTSAQRHRAHIAEAIKRSGLAPALTAKGVITQLLGELRTLADDCLTAESRRDFLLVADRLDRSANSLGKITGEISPSAMQLFVNLGVRGESEIRSALDLARTSERMTLEELFTESIEALRFVIAEKPELRESALTALGREPSEAAVIEPNWNGSGVG